MSSKRGIRIVELDYESILPLMRGEFKITSLPKDARLIGSIDKWGRNTILFKFDSAEWPEDRHEGEPIVRIPIAGEKWTRFGE